MARIKYDPSDGRGQTSSVANLLLAAIAIVAVGTLGYYGFQMVGQLNAGPPTTELQTTYDRAAGEVRIELINGDAIDTDHLRIEGGVAPRESWADDSLTAGEAVTYAANPGDEVQVIWEKGNESYVMTTFTVPVPSGWYTVADWDRESDGDSLSLFRDLYEPVDTQGLTWEEKNNDYVRVAQTEEGNPSWARHELALPANNGSLRLTLHFEADSFEDSGIKIYAVAADGDKHVLRCDPSGNSLSNDIEIDCPDGGGDRRNFVWDGTYSVDADSELEKLVIKIDMENIEPWYDEGRFYQVTTEVYGNEST